MEWSDGHFSYEKRINPKSKHILNIAQRQEVTECLKSVLITAPNKSKSTSVENYILIIVGIKLCVAETDTAVWIRPPSLTGKVHPKTKT